MTAPLLALAFLPAAAAGSACTFALDGVPTARFDCRAGGAWTVSCPLPEAREGKVRVTLHLPERGLQAEARIPLATHDAVKLSVSGPGARAGSFLVDGPVLDLLPGQAVGPNQLCPVVQAGAVPGAPPVELALEVRVSQHAVLGWDEVELDGGVTTRVARYDEGRVTASGVATVVQRGVELIPILAGADALQLDEPVSGTVQVRSGEAWASIGYSGVKRAVPLTSADLSLLVVDLVAPEVGSALGGDPVAAVAADLTAWLGGETTPLGSAWARCGLRPPLPGLVLAEPRRDAWAWRIGESARIQVRVGRLGDRLRVLIVRSTAELDDEARNTIADAAGA